MKDPLDFSERHARAMAAVDLKIAEINRLLDLIVKRLGMNVTRRRNK